jgi:hypothetical protein
MSAYFLAPLMVAAVVAWYFLTIEMGVSKLKKRFESWTSNKTICFALSLGQWASVRKKFIIRYGQFTENEANEVIIVQRICFMQFIAGCIVIFTLFLVFVKHSQ